MPSVIREESKYKESDIDPDEYTDQIILPILNLNSQYDKLSVEVPDENEVKDKIE